MLLIQILLPLYDNRGRRISRALLRRTTKALANEYGGVTAYSRAPAEGLWKKGAGKIDRDDVIVCEIMVRSANRKAWAARRTQLETAFRQQEVVIRALRFSRL